MAHSHSLSGGVAGLTAGILLHKTLPATTALGVLTAGMALLPDLDSVGSCSARSLGWLSRGAAYVIRFACRGHRHASHSLIGIAAFTALAWLACYFRHDWAGLAGLAFLVALSVSAGLEALRVLDGHKADVAGVAAAVAVAWFGYGLALIPLAMLLGCCTHIAGDMCTDSGCMLAYPLSSYRFHLLPEPAAFTTGSDPERWIVDPLLILAVAALSILAIDPASGPLAWAYVTHYI